MNKKYTLSQKFNILLVAFSLIFIGLNPTTTLLADTRGDVEFWNTATPASGCFQASPNNPQTLNWVTTIINRSASTIGIVSAGYHDNTAGCSPTVAQRFSWTPSGGQTSYAPNENNQTRFTYNTSQYACGRIQVDAYISSDTNSGFIGYIINYGVNCGAISGPTPGPTPGPGPVPLGRIIITTNVSGSPHYTTGSGTAASFGNRKGWNGNHTWDQVPLGTYTVSPDNLPGYNPPTVTPGGTQIISASSPVATFNINYTPVSSTPTTCQERSANNFGGALPCTYNPAPAACVGTVSVTSNIQSAAHYTTGSGAAASWGRNGWNGNHDWTGVPCGQYSVSADSVSGYNPPTVNPNGTQNLSSGGRIAFNINYTQTAAPTCQDTSANNRGGALPCTYTLPTCQDPAANNRGGALPCTYPAPTCQDPSANNFRGSIPCTYTQPVQTCQDPSASNYRANGTCIYPAPTCQDPSANNFRGSIPCTYPARTQTSPIIITNTNTNTINNNPVNTNTNTSTNTNNNTSPGSGYFGGSYSYPSPYMTPYATPYPTPITYSYQYQYQTPYATPYITPIAYLTPYQTPVTISRTAYLTPYSTPTSTVVSRTVVPASSLVIINSSIDRNQAIIPTLSNTNPRVGDEINYTVTYQNIGTGSITNLSLQINLPLEVEYMFSNPSNPSVFGNTLIFSLGTLRANAQGTVTVRVRVRNNIPPGTNLNFPATLSYTNPSGQAQSVTANVSAQVWSEPAVVVPLTTVTTVAKPLEASAFLSGTFLPANLFGWLLLLVLLLVLVLLAKYIFEQPRRVPPPPPPYH